MVLTILVYLVAKEINKINTQEQLVRNLTRTNRNHTSHIARPNVGP